MYTYIFNHAHVLIHPHCTTYTLIRTHCTLYVSQCASYTICRTLYVLHPYIHSHIYKQPHIHTYIYVHIYLFINRILLSSSGTVWSSEARRCDFPDPGSPDSCQAVRFRVQKRRKPILQPNQALSSPGGIAGFPNRRVPHQRTHLLANQERTPPSNNHRMPPAEQRAPIGENKKPSGRSHFHISKFPVYRFEDGRRSYGSVAAAASGSMNHVKPRYPSNVKQQQQPGPLPHMHSNQLQRNHNTYNKVPRQHHPQYNNVQLSVRKDLKKTDMMK